MKRARLRNWGLSLNRRSLCNNRWGWNKSVAVLYYTSQYFIWWDFGGMTIQDRNTGGIDPNCHHPKPRPTTPQDFVDSIDLQYRKETC